VQAVLTTVPMTIGMFWLLVLYSAMWRRTVWLAMGGLLERARERGAVLEPVRAGYQLRRAGNQVTVRWGLRGPKTVSAEKTMRRLPTEPEIQQALSADGAPPESV